MNRETAFFKYPLFRGGLSIFILLLIAVSFYLFSSGSRETYVFTRPLLGTIVNITICADKKTAQAASAAAFEEIARIEALMSPYKKNSDVYRINESASGGYVSVGIETFGLLEISKRVSSETGGAFDITFAGLDGLWKTGSDSFIPPKRQDVLRRLYLVNSKNIELAADNRVRFRNKGMRIGLGAIAKGYAVKRAVEVLRGLGIGSAIVEAGGDLQVIGSKYGKPWGAGIRNPRADSISFALFLNNGESVVTSGDYERFSIYEGKRYHHIIDPRTGFPAEKFSSVTVLHRDPVMADAWSTSIFVMGHKRSVEFLKARGDISAVMISLDMKVTASASLRNRMQSLDGLPVEWID